MFNGSVIMEKENDSDIVRLFNVRLCYCLTGISRTCALIRKHKENLQTSGDFSFPVQLEYWLNSVPFVPNFAAANLKTILEYSYLNRVQVPETDTVCDGEEWVMQNIMETSKSWPLVVSKCALKCNRVQLYLNRKLTFKYVLQSVLSQKCMYGQFSSKQQRFVVTSDGLQEDRHKMDLSELRIELLRSTVTNLLKAVGYKMADIEKSYEEESIIYLHLSTKSSSETVSGYQRVICGVVTNSRHHCKESTITAQEYVRQRCRDIKTMAMHKYGDLIQPEPWWETLGDAAVRIDLLHVKPSHTVCLNLGTEGIGTLESSNKGAVFILYNCARIAAILRQFEEKVQLGYYPQLIPYEEVDFLLLSKEEEWDLIFSYLLSYPSVLQNSVQNVEHGKVAPHLVCTFVMAMCSCFSVYYRRVRILTDSRNQLLPVMFARLYLLRSVQQVLHNALSLLGIRPVVHM